MQINQKRSNLELLVKHLKLSKEQRAVKKGFVEVTKDGKRVDICQVKSKEQITLVNDKCKLEVRALEDSSTF